MHPQAHYINNRTMEVFRGMPAPAEYSDTCDESLSAAVQTLSPSLSEWRRFKYVDALIGGQVFGDVDHFKG